MQGKAGRRLVVGTPFGRFERRTPRAYTHVVIVKGLTEAELERSQKLELASVEYRLRAWRDWLERGDFSYSQTREGVERDVASEQARFDALPEKHRQERERNGKLASDYRWSQSLALAEKGAAEACKYGYVVAGIYPVAGGNR